jgi:hypothetical protein
VVSLVATFAICLLASARVRVPFRARAPSRYDRHFGRHGVERLGADADPASDNDQDCDECGLENEKDEPARG